LPSDIVVYTTDLILYTIIIIFQNGQLIQGRLH
jgi:hypothetical protein